MGPSAPYYPGDLFVDAAGVSVYCRYTLSCIGLANPAADKGPDRANRNAPQPGGFCEDMYVITKMAYHLLMI